jgi:hypothetical protein
VDLSPADAGLYGPRKLVWARNGLDRGVRHEVELTVVGGRADLDAIVVLR